MAKDYLRPTTVKLWQSLQTAKDLIHVVMGPRQVGKTTAATQIEKRWKGSVHYAAADGMQPFGIEWIENQWHVARRLSECNKLRTLLILDEVQKVQSWSEIVKRLWDEDQKQGRRIAVLLLGSSSILLQHGLSESLAGRFTLFRFAHWSWTECKAKFAWDLESWLFFGGYPKAALYYKDEGFWRSYITDSLIETAITRDVLQMQHITKPTLLRHLFALAAAYPAQILSYNKMLGQLQDVGNTTTLAHYLRLLETAFLVSGLERFPRDQAKKRGSSPKLILWNNGLIHALSQKNFKEARNDGSWWGRIVENAVGGHLLNCLQGLPYSVTYWRERSNEVDFVVRTADKLWAIEVKSGRPLKASGLYRLKEKFSKTKSLIIGSGGIPLEEFFAAEPKDILS